MIIETGEHVTIATTPTKIYKILDRYMKGLDEVDRDKEHFFTFHLDSRNRIMLLDEVSVGTVNASLIHPREVFTRAVLYRSVNLILAHNHPSGDATPSTEDIEMTRRLVECGRILGIGVLDHIIYTERGYSSMEEGGLI